MLILGDREDPHVCVVVDKLRRSSFCDFAVFDPAEARDADLRVMLSGTQGVAELTTDEGVVKSEHVRVVWRRRPRGADAEDIEDLVQRGFVKNETNHAVAGFLSLIENATWFNSPEAERVAGNKVSHTLAAARVGLTTADSLVTNQPEIAGLFLEEGSTVYKTLGGVVGAFSECPECVARQQPSGESRSFDFSTKLLSPSQDLSGLQVAPGILQRFVPKEYDVRVTVFGGRAVATEFHSQTDARSIVDFRVRGDVIPRAPHDLPDEIAARCVALLDHFGLRVATLDFAVTGSEYVFLDLNPDGQFLFMDDDDLERVAGPFARHLMAEAS
ncbi:hypothetical protein H1W00_09480 [Aeromicrobium sp. Marseille-Q0843]|uniref:ATP-grasp domain-containing protein n=1 Tax=Aeromicrobium phoceense TaxID=2754045 RepID=A0A838XFE2_9ACTN|nr:hypothetical protein [Aeromicrobium phoceense]MBA4608702.1 hypothetical protein [Aeromicrobium phoceense]